MEYGAAAYESSDEEFVEHDPQRSAKRKREKFLYDEEQSKNRLEVMRVMEEEVDRDEDNSAFGGLQKVERYEEIDDVQLATDSETEKRKQDVNKALSCHLLEEQPKKLPVDVSLESGFLLCTCDRFGKKGR